MVLMAGMHMYHAVGVLDDCDALNVQEHNTIVSVCVVHSKWEINLCWLWEALEALYRCVLC
jgi:hypothetical protein